MIFNYARKAYAFRVFLFCPQERQIGFFHKNPKEKRISTRENRALAPCHGRKNSKIRKEIFI